MTQASGGFSQDYFWEAADMTHRKHRDYERPKFLPTPAQIAAGCKEIQDEKAALHAAKLQIPAKQYTVRGLDLRPARIGE